MVCGPQPAQVYTFLFLFSLFGHTVWLMELWCSPTRAGTQGPHSESAESWPLNPDGIPASFLILYQRSFIYLQHFSVLFLHLSSVSLWPALPPLGTFQFSGPLRQQNSCNAGAGGFLGVVWGVKYQKLLANPAPNYKYPFSQREGYTWNLHRLVPEFTSKKNVLQSSELFSVSFSAQIAREAASNSCVEKHPFLPYQTSYVNQLNQANRKSKVPILSTSGFEI